jgi:hypothetical protein
LSGPPPAPAGEERPLAGADTGPGVGRWVREGPPADARLAAWVFALLVLACVAAFLITQRLKHTPTLVQRFELTSALAPAAGGALAEERIAFKLAEADDVTVQIEALRSEAVVATLVRGLPVARYKIVSLRWNGREGAAREHRTIRRADGYTTLVPVNRGRPAPAGEYRVKLSLRKQDRTVQSPRAFKLVRP